MLLKDNTQRRPKKHERRSARKHEGVRTPTARNAVVKDPEQGYQARVDADRDEELSSLRLRVNALELEVNRLKRQGAVDRGYAAPYADPAVKPVVGQAASNVVPMTVARQAKAEKESAARASHPLPVSGNEAHALPSPSTEPAQRKANPPELVHPSQVAPVSSREAANDSVVPDKESADALLDITDVPAADVATLAEGYGMTLEEASEILYREYSKRELHCYNKHGKSRADVQLGRMSAQHSTVEPGGYVSAKDVGFGFSSWWNETESRMKNLRANSAARTAAEYRSPAHYVPLTKGEAKYRKRAALKSMAAMRTADRAKFGRVQKVSKQLTVPAPVTTAAQVEALRTAAWGGYQRVRKLLGMQPTVRNQALRTRAELVTDMEASQGADFPKNAHRTAKAPVDLIGDATTPMRELVRRYQRAGIV